MEMGNREEAVRMRKVVCYGHRYFRALCLCIETFSVALSERG